MGLLNDIFHTKGSTTMDNFFNTFAFHPAETLLNNAVGTTTTAADAYKHIGGAIGNAADGIGDGLNRAGGAAGDIMEQLSKIMPFAALGFGAIIVMNVTK